MTGLQRSKDGKIDPLSQPNSCKYLIICLYRQATAGGVLSIHKNIPTVPLGIDRSTADALFQTLLRCGNLIVNCLRQLIQRKRFL